MAARIVPLVNLPEDLRILPLSKAQRNLARYVRAARRAPILLTRRGRPAALLSDMSVYDMEDVGYMTDPAFWRMIEKARKEPTIPIAEVRRRLGLPPFKKRTRRTRGRRAG